MAEKALTAVLKAQEDVSKALADIADALEEVATDAGVADETLETVANAADSTRNSSSALSASLNKVNEDLSDVSVEAMQAAQTSEELGSAMDTASRAQSKLSGTADATESKLDEEAQTFREALRSANSLAEAKDAASRANSVLSSTARRTEEAVEDEIGAMYRMVQASGTVSEFVDRLRNSNLAAAQAADILEEEMDDLSVASLSAALPAKFFAMVLDDVEDNLEEVDDQAQKAALSIAGLGGAFSSTSLNIGPFNFALRRAAVQIPQLVITTGALATSLLGLASAATIAGGALAGIFAGGLIAKADRVAASSSDIEGRLEALEEIAGNVRDMFIRALEPLIDAESIGIFEGTLTSLATTVNLLAQVADNLQDDLVAAGQEISNAFGDNSTAILREMENVTEAFLPLIVDLFGYFANELPDALQFFQNEGVSFTRTLGEIGKQIISFFRTFTEVGIPILEGAITAISGVLGAFELVANVVNTLPDGVIELVASFLFLSRIFDGVLAKGLSVGMFVKNFSGSVSGATGALAKFNSVLGGLELTGLQRGLGNILEEFSLLKPVVANSSDAAADSLKQFDEFDLPDAGESLKENFSDFDDPISAALSRTRSRLSEFKDAAITRISNLPSALRSRASGIKDALVAPFSNAKNSISERLTEINQVTGGRDIASDVALGGPRLTDDQKPQDMVLDTRTGKARRKLASLRDTAVDTAGKLRRNLISAFGTAGRGARNFASTGLTMVSDGLKSIAARGLGAGSVLTGLGEAAVSAVPGLGNFNRATENIRSGLTTLLPEIFSFKDSLIGAIPTMDEVNESALGFADSIQNRLDPYLDGFNEKFFAFEDTVNTSIDPALESTNERLLNFTDALDPNQDLTFYDIASQKVSVLGSKAKSAGESVAESLLNVDFSDSGIRNLRTGQFTSFGDAIKDRALGPVRLLQSGLGAASDKFSELKNSALSAVPTMDEINESAIGFTESLQSRLDPHLDSANEKFFAFEDTVSNTIDPALENTNDKLLNFTDALDPNQDLTFYDMFSSKLGKVKSRARGAGEAVVGSLLGVSFEDSGLRDLQTGQFSSLSQVIRDRLASAAQTAVGPFRRLGGSIKQVGSQVRSVAGNFAASVADIGSYDEALSLVGDKTDTVKSRLTSLGGGALGAVSRGFTRVKSSVTSYAGSLIPANLGTKNLLGSIKNLAFAPIKAIGSIASLATTLYAEGSAALFSSIMSSSLATSLASVAAMGIPVVSSMAAATLSFFSVAAAEGVATAATTALAVALSGIGWTQIVVALTAIVAAAGLMAGALSNIGGVSNAVGGTIDFLKGVLESIFNFLLAIGVPTWNLFIDILEAILAPAFAIKDAFDRLAQGLGFANEEGSAMGLLLNGIGASFSALGDAIGFVIALFQGPFNVIADIIYAAIFIPLKLIVDSIILAVNTVEKLVDAFMGLTIVQNTLTSLQQGVDRIRDAFQGLKQAVSGAVGFVEGAIEGMVNTVINAINSLIQRANSSLPDQFEIDTLSEYEMGGQGGQGAAGRLAGADASAQAARNTAAGSKKEDNQSAQGDQAPAPNHETNNYETNEYNFGDFNMKPEEKARVKGLVQDAIGEANREKRFRDGGN